MAKRETNEIDGKILDLLKKDARQSYSEIGEKVGLSRVAVKNRVAAMEESGIIKGYHAEVDSASSSEQLPFYAVIITKTDKYDSVAEQLKSEPVVASLFKVSGNNRILAICVASSKEERASFAWKMRTSVEGVEDFSATDIWETVKGSILPN